MKIFERVLNAADVVRLVAVLLLLALEASAANWHVDSKAGNDAADGKTPQTAWRSLGRVNAAGEVEPGDRVLFRRGGEWRGTLRPRSGVVGKPVTYSNYGQGPKPILERSVDASSSSFWVEAGTGIWASRNDAAGRLPFDVGIVLLNHGEKWGIRKWWVHDLRQPLDYWYDKGTGRVYLNCPTNPAVAFKSVELALTQHVVDQSGAQNVVYDGLTVRYTGAHGFGGSGGTANIVIRNCDICWIGGGVHSWRKNPTPGAAPYAIRFGNAIEFWGGCRNILVERNRIWQVFDTALTIQSENDPRPQANVVWRDNVIWQSEYSFEYWNHDKRSRTANVLFEHNTCVDAASWGHGQRPDPNGTHLTFFRNDAAVTNFVVRNNVFCRPEDFGVRMFNDWCAKPGCHDGLVLKNNLYYVPSGKVFVRYCENPVSFAAGAGEFARYQSELGQDAHSIYGEPRFVDAARRDYRLKSGSFGSARATDGGPMGARNMPGLDGDQSLSAMSLATPKTTNEEKHP